MPNKVTFVAFSSMEARVEARGYMKLYIGYGRKIEKSAT